MSLRIAAIDVGSNATRLSTVCIRSTGVSSEAVLVRYPLRLGADVFSKGRIGPSQAQALLKILQKIAHQLKTDGIQAYRAVATAALREARNAAAVLEAIQAQTGLQVQVIDGLQESHLVCQAMVRALGGVPPETLVLDLGGGSLEVQRAGARRGRSVPLGTVRLLHLYPELIQTLTASQVAMLRQQIFCQVKRCWPHPKPSRLALGTGGNLEALCQLIPLKNASWPTLDVAALEPLAEEVGGTPFAQRADRFKVRADRADLILPAVLVILALQERFGLQRLVVPGTGLRDALLYGLATPASVGLPASARRMMEKGSLKAQPVRLAALWARRLFEALAGVHGLWPPALQPMWGALVLYFATHTPRASVSEALWHAWIPDVHAQRMAHWICQALQDVHVPWTGESADGKAAHILAGILRLAMGLVMGLVRQVGSHQTQRAVAKLAVDVLQETIHIHVPAAAPLDPDMKALLEHALERRITLSGS